jgi:drug/metabolite transporter (DMT)-like permease
MPRNRAASTTGLLLALLSAGTFGTSGTFATSLLNAGWSPAAAVTARVGVAAVILTWPAVVQLRRHWPTLRAEGRPALRRSAAMVAAYALIAVLGGQLFYFHAVERLTVGVALLLEYLGIVLVVGWVWLRYGQRPRRLTVAGSVGAALGLVFVLDLTGGQHLDPIGVLYGLCAAVGLAVYFVLSGRAEEPLPPVVMAWAAMVVATVFLVLAAAVGAAPFSATFGDVDLGGRSTSWLVPVAGLSVVAAAVAYVAGIEAARRLGARLASFVGLTEVIFAVLVAWAVLGQLPNGTQLLGGVLILVGVTLVRVDELRAPRDLSTERTERTDAAAEAPAVPVAAPAGDHG